MACAGHSLKQGLRAEAGTCLQPFVFRLAAATGGFRSAHLGQLRKLRNSWSGLPYRIAQ
jgi:hypothetical protein